MHKPAIKTKVGHNKSHLLPPMKHDQTSVDFVVSNMSFATSRTVYHKLYTHYICRVYIDRVGLINVSVYHAKGGGFAPRSGDTKDHHKNGTNCK